MAPRTAKHELPQGKHCFSGSNYKTGAIPIFQREFCCGAGGSEIGADRHPSCHGSCVRNRRSLDALEGLRSALGGSPWLLPTRRRALMLPAISYSIPLWMRSTQFIGLRRSTLLL